jgi:uncharacterized membrane protein
MSEFPLPVQPPAAPATSPTSTPPADGWAVDAGHGAAWWSDGWRLFTASPWIWIAILIIYVLIMIGLGFIPFLGQIASSLLWPVLGAGTLIGARELDRGGALKVEHLFACLNAKAVPLIIVALLYYLGWLILWVAAAAVLVMMFGLNTLSSLMSSDPSEAGLALLDTFGIGSLLVLLVAALFAVPLVMAYWFAPALVVFRGADPVGAMKTSFVACLRNVPPFLIYSLLGLVFAIVATIPFGLGWLALGPVYVCSLYASYKDIFGAPQ